MRKTFLVKTTVFRSEVSLTREIEILTELKRRAFYKLADEVPYDEGARVVITYEKVVTKSPEPVGFYYMGNVEFDHEKTMEHPKTLKEKLIAIFDVLW